MGDVKWFETTDLRRAIFPPLVSLIEVVKRISKSQMYYRAKIN